MANIPAATNATPVGVNITTLPTAAISSMTLANDGKTILVVRTVGTGATLTLTPQSKIQDGSAAGIAGVPPAIVLGTNETRVFGPFPTGVYNDANGELNLAFSAVTAITVQAIRVNPQG